MFSRRCLLRYEAPANSYACLRYFSPCLISLSRRCRRLRHAFDAAAAFAATLLDAAITAADFDTALFF